VNKQQAILGRVTQSVEKMLLDNGSRYCPQSV